MSLHIYDRKEDIPSGIKYVESNDIFFNGHNMLTDSSFTREVISTIDRAEYVNEEVFLGVIRCFGNLFKKNLSTGCKTILNIAGCKDRCFNVAECGQNAIDFLWGMSDGYIFWEHPVAIPSDEDESCDIVFRNKHFTNRFDFLDYSLEVHSDENNI